MLELINDAIVEKGSVAQVAKQNRLLAMQSFRENSQSCLSGSSGGAALGSYTIDGCCTNNKRTINWGSYPVYVCTDKTAKAIEILKALQADKILEVKSVPKFIELVEKISGIL